MQNGEQDITGSQDVGLSSLGLAPRTLDLQNIDKISLKSLSKTQNFSASGGGASGGACGGPDHYLPKNTSTSCTLSEPDPGADVRSLWQAR
jgi:hypothetical protein|eukprot:1882890-Prymnesium_polylepis.1